MPTFVEIGRSLLIELSGCHSLVSLAEIRGPVARADAAEVIRLLYEWSK
jgi:hypothetical protein